MKHSATLKDRALKAAGLLAHHKIDALLLTNLTNISYLSGFSGSNAFLLLHAKGGTFYTDFRYKESVCNEIFGYEVEIYTESLLKSVAHRLSQLKVKRLGFEASSLPYAYYADIKKEMPGVTLVPTKGCVEGLREIKDCTELTLIKDAVSVIERVLCKAKRFLKAGVSENEVAFEIDYLMRTEGADKESFDTIVAFGESSSMPHAKLSGRRLKKGDAVLIDIGCSVKGYSSDLTRTFFFNSINARQKKVYETVLAAQKKALAVIRPGITAADIDKAARHHISAKGYGKEFGHALGHGVGREVHELPRISSMNEEKVREGMVFTVEPGIYIPGWGGVRIEDMVAVTGDGCEVLMRAPKELDAVVL